MPPIVYFFDGVLLSDRSNALLSPPKPSSLLRDENLDSLYFIIKSEILKINHFFYDSRSRKNTLLLLINKKNGLFFRAGR